VSDGRTCCGDSRARSFQAGREAERRDTIERLTRRARQYEEQSLEHEGVDTGAAKRAMRKRWALESFGDALKTAPWGLGHLAQEMVEDD
jgi:hypothetical protein